MTTTKQELERNLIHRVNVGDALTRTAAHHPEQDAIVDGDRRFSYRKFDEWVNRVAHGFSARGYSRGDALAIMSGNSAEFLVTYYACAKIGVVCVPLNLGWRDAESTYVMGHAKVKGVVVESQLLTKIEAALGPVPAAKDIFVARGLGEAWKPAVADRKYEDFEAIGNGQSDGPPEVYIEDRDPLSYLYTSGTTAAPKGVVGTHLAIHLESLTVAVDMEIRRRDRVLCLMPMFHTAQINAFCTPAVTVGATMVILRGFDDVKVLDLVQREKLSMLFALPMMYRALVALQEKEPRDISTLRYSVYAMTPMPDRELRKALEVLKCDFALLFGQTEMSPVSTVFRPEHQLSHIGAVGTAGVNVEVAIMSDDGKRLPRGERGEIVYRGPHTVERYLYDEEATNKAFAHGWFHSGDAGYLGEDGMLWFEDRFKDVIKSGGENVASIEVEKMVYEVAPEVAQAVVIGLPHDHWIEAITVIAVAAPGQSLDPEAILAKMKAKLSSFKAPKAVIVREAMPMTSTGKIQKHLLRKEHQEHYRGQGK